MPTIWKHGTENDWCHICGSRSGETADVEAHDMVISATRYYIGRMTIQAFWWAKCLAQAWEELPESTRGVIRRDLEQAFRDDDESRERGESRHPLGHDCDRQAWEQVRQAWQKVEAGWNAAMAERERATAVLYAAIRLACSDGWIPVSDEERELEQALMDGGYIEQTASD